MSFNILDFFGVGIILYSIFHMFSTVFTPKKYVYYSEITNIPFKLFLTLRYAFAFIVVSIGVQLLKW